MKFFTKEKKWSDCDGDYTKRVLNIPHILIAVFFIITLFSSFAVIPSGYTGVRTTFGQVDPNPVASGFTWKIPLVQSIEKVNNKQQDVKIESQIWSETSERTALYYENITVTYTINPEYSAWIIAHVTKYRNSLVSEDLVASAIKSSSKQLSSVDATNRGVIEPLAQETLQASLNAKYGNEVIYINRIVISNVDFEESYNRAIADKQKAQLAYETAQIENQKMIESANKDAEIVRIQTEYQTKAKEEQARADAEVRRIAAAADADAIETVAHAQSAANRELSQSVSALLIDYEKVNKWDGKLPQVTGGGIVSFSLPNE